MLNYIWPLFLIISFIYGVFSGNIENTNSAIFESTESAVNLCIKLLGTICFWNGIMKIAEKTSLINKLNNWMRPILKKLFPKIKEDEKVFSEISMNVVANVMGLRKCSNAYGLEGNEVFTNNK